MSVAIIAVLLDAATALFSMITAAKTAQSALNDPERKQQVADIFAQIADTLTEAVEKLRQNEIPHGACQSLAHYGQVLPSILSGVINDGAAHFYGTQLVQAHNVESLIIAVRDGGADQLVELEKAAGIFRAASYTVVLE